MVETIGSIVFWTLFLAGFLPALSFLVGTLLRNTVLSTARVEADDGDEDPSSISYKVYDLSIASDTLAIGAWVALLPLAASLVAAVAGSGIMPGLGAIALAVVTAFVADALRTRHERLEARFEEIAGVRVDEAYARVMDRRTLPTPHAARRTARID